MTTRSIYLHHFDSDSPDEPILAKLNEAADLVQQEFRSLRQVFQIGNIGVWEQLDEVELYVTKPWLKIFGQKHSETSLDEYLALIADAGDRERVREARENLVFQKVGTRWSDEFTLCGKRIQSTAIVTVEQILVGVDVVLNGQ